MLEFQTLDTRDVWWGVVTMETGTRITTPIKARISVKVPLCECWPFFALTYRLATFRFEGDSYTGTHTSHIAPFDVRRLFKCSQKMNAASAHIKICVHTLNEKLEARTELDVFLDEVTRPGIVKRFFLMLNDGNSSVTLILSSHDRLLGRVLIKELELDKNYGTRLEDIIVDEEQTNDKTIDTGSQDERVQRLTNSLEDESVESISLDSLEVDSVKSCSQDSLENESVIQEENTKESPFTSLSRYIHGSS